MKPAPVKPILQLKHGSDIVLSGEDLLVLMQAVLGKGAAFNFRAKGLSMTPFIEDGDLLTVQPLSRCKLRLGAIVAFIRPTTGRLMVHRLVGKQDEGFLIRGDNAIAPANDLVQKQDILGCVTRVERNGRRIFLGLGPERYPIALFSKTGYLVRIINRLRVFIQFFVTKKIE